MKYILAARNRRHLVGLAGGRTLLAFDFDGTLAPIVADRNAATMRPRTARLFREVCAAYPCAVISGRSREDVTQRLGDVPVRYVVGDHGADTGTPRVAYHQQMADVSDGLRRVLAGQQGIEIEAKGASMAIHYRLAPSPDEARELIEAAVAPLEPRVRVVPGKRVLNLVPAEAPDKGDAFRQLLRAEHADRALYVGDDDTDEDVFGLKLPERPITVRIGASRRSRAEYFLREQREIDDMLRILAPPHGSPRPRAPASRHPARN